MILKMTDLSRYTLQLYANMYAENTEFISF